MPWSLTMDLDGLPEPILKTGRWRLSIIWLIPAVAALIGGWMAFRALALRGPTVVVTFQSGEGLEAGQTRIRVKDVNMGKVTAVNLSADLSQVLVTAELKKEAADLLSENSRFWVVRARIGTAGITGLGTLLSGAYIGFDPGKPGPEGSKPPRHFKGLEAAPIITGQAGRLITLRAEQLGSLNIGSPVHFRQIQVGEVAAFDLDKGGQAVAVKIFIHAPYDALVRKDTRFWDAGGVELTADANGIRLRSDSLVDLMLGGIAFENPITLQRSEEAKGDEVFVLYPDHDRIRERLFLERHYYVVNFSESVRGLSRGAPVEFRGIKVGEVEDLSLEFHTDTLEGKVPVLIAVEPERFTLVGGQHGSTDQIMRTLVERGLRAQLKMGSLLTGSLFVDLVFQPKAPRRAMGRYGAYPELPSTPSSLGVLVDKLTAFAERLEKLPLEEVVEQLRSSLPVLKATLKETTGLMARLNQETVPQAQATLAQAQATLGALERTLRSDSPTQQDLHGALEAFTRAARAMKDLADTLERHPEAIVFGKGKNP
jgi:paraquat-inducible protein B